MAKQTRKPAAERKAEIVDTAIRLAAELGPDRLTTDKLAAAIGISQAAIFRHFSNKTAIWEAVSRKIGETMSNVVVSIGSDPVSQLKNMVRGQLAFVAKTPAVPAILFSRELHAENEDLRLFFAKMMAKRHENLTKVIQAGIDSGQFADDLDPTDASYLVLAFIQGLAMRWSMNARNFDLEAEGARLFAQMLSGFTRN